MRREPLGLNNKSIAVIEKGMELDEKFWDNFLQILNNTDGLAQLLDISSSKISTWHEKIKDADLLLLGFQVPIGKDIIDAMPNLKLISILATAYGTVDLEAARAKGITVCNIADYSTEAVAEFIIALMVL